MSNEAFVTLATNDTYGLGALVLGRSLRRVATSKQTVVLVTADVSQKMKDELGQVFNLVVTVDTLDSGDAAHLALMSRPELGITFTKLHAWRLVQFSKCVFLDADTLVVQNCDELFEREELSAAPDPGWPDCFNSGVFVFVPSEATFKTLMDFAVTHGSFDGGDQGLLNMFFSDWATGDIRKHLPFIYNVVSSATYSYLPALKHFGSQVKIAHFLGTNKPWMRQGQLGTSSPYQRAWWSIFREDVAGRLSQDMAGVAGVLARGEPDDWRREAWEAGDVDYLGRDSFDNIWKRICECVGITAQTLSAPAAPAATSAGIANQPPAPAPTTEKVEATAPPTEKPSVTIPEKQTEPIISAEKPLSPSALPEKQAEPDVASQKQAEPDTAVQKQAEPIVASEKPAETAAPVEKPVDTAVVEKPAEPAVPVEKPAEPEAQKQVEPVVSIEKSVESTAPADKPAEPIAPAEKPVEPVTSAEIPAEPIIPAEKPVEPVVTSDKPGEPVISAEKPAEPVLIADKQAEPAVPAEKPVESVTSAEKPTEPAAGAEKSSEPSITSEKLAPVPEKLPETAPAAVEISAVADKDRLVESTPAVEPSESPKAVELEKPAASAPPEEKLTKQEAPEVEKAATAVSEPPTKTTTAEKPEQSAITLPKETDTVPSEKKAEATPKLEKPVETGPTGEKPMEKPAEPSQETVKPAEPLEAAEMCPLKPTKSKPAAPEAPVSISSQPTASESSSKSGEARVQPPLVGDEAPVCKQEPGTPTITPPSGPGSPQPADVPPEVCKLQATASQPATPPASSHQTTDAPVPPKRKQGKNGKSGKGKK